MQTVGNYLQAVFTAIGGFLAWFLGGLVRFLYTLIAFVAIDYLTGLMCAVVDKKLSSEVGAKGIFKKVLIFGLVGEGLIIESQVLGNGGAIRTAVIFFYLSNERVSILETAAHIGLPIPDVLKNAMEQLHDRSNEEDEKK